MMLNVDEIWSNTNIFQFQIYSRIHTATILLDTNQTHEIALVRLVCLDKFYDAICMFIDKPKSKSLVQSPTSLKPPRVKYKMGKFWTQVVSLISRFTEPRLYCSFFLGGGEPRFMFWSQSPLGLTIGTRGLGLTRAWQYSFRQTTNKLFLIVC